MVVDKIINFMVILTIIFNLPSVCIIECGRVKRVIRGEEVACGTQNRIVSLQNASNSHHLCGATVLFPNIAITAAHCVEHEPKHYRLQFNNYCVNDNIITPNAQVLEIITHPMYDRFSMAHDIAVLMLQPNLDDKAWLNGTVLPNSSFGISGECIVYGYGYNDRNTKELPEKLLAAKLRLISLDECIKLLGPHVAPEYDSGMMCAMGDQVDACQGDSGGPLMCGGKLEGVSGYGQGCAIPGVPGVYVSIGAHLQWLKSVIDNLKISNLL